MQRPPGRSGRPRSPKWSCHALPLAALASATTPVSAGIVYQTATLGPTGQTGGSTVSSSAYIGVKFQLTQATMVNLIGGHFSGVPGSSSIFGAVVQLSDAADFPDSTSLSTSDVLSVATFDTPGYFSDDVAADIVPINLNPGWYALVFGSGGYGATGSAAAAWNNPQVGSPQHFHSFNGQAWNSTTATTRYFLGTSVARTWNNASGGSWNSGANWNPGQAPDVYDDVEFNLAETYTVTFADTGVVRNLTNQRDNVTLDLGGEQLTVGSGVRVGSPTGAASLTVNNGTLAQSQIRNIIVGAGGNGTLSVSSQGTINSPLGDLTVGSAADGQLLIGNVGVINTNGGYVAHDIGEDEGTITSSGTVQILSGGTWNVSGSLHIGRNGPGLVEVNPNGTLDAFAVHLHNTTGTALVLQGGTFKGVINTYGNPSNFQWTSGTWWNPFGNVVLSPLEQLGVNLTLGPGMTLRADQQMKIEYSPMGSGHFTLAGGTLQGASVMNDGTWTQTSGTATIASLGQFFPERGDTHITGGTLLTSHIRQSSLHVGGSGAVNLRPNTGTVHSTSRLRSITTSGSGKLDLKDNRLIVSNAFFGSWNGSAYTGVIGLIDSARGSAGNALWDGPTGITTTDPRAINTANLASIGIARAFETGDTEFGGLSVTGGNILIRLTWGGDANLDGIINIDDYGRIDGNVGQSGSVFGWFNGDFNYDGKINIDDYGIIDGNIGRQEGSFPITQDLTGAIAAVPEPAVLPGILLLMLSGVRRRRKARVPEFACDRAQKTGC